MKKLITLLVTTVFCVSLFAPPLAAMVRNPDDPLTWVDPRERPHGDDVGFNETDFIGDGEIIWMTSYFEIYVSKYFIIYFIPKNIEKDKPIEENDLTNSRDTGRSRTTSPR